MRNDEDVEVMIKGRTLAATYSPTGEPAVPLALKCFTAGFGMGPGGSTLLWPPEEQWFCFGMNRCFSGEGILRYFGLFD